MIEFTGNLFPSISQPRNNMDMQRDKIIERKYILMLIPGLIYSLLIDFRYHIVYFVSTFDLFFN